MPGSKGLATPAGASPTEPTGALPPANDCAFAALPAAMHIFMTSFVKTSDRLEMATTSHGLLELWGSSMTTIVVSRNFQRVRHLSKTSLSTLLQRQRRLEKLVGSWEAGSLIARGIAAGHCRSLEELCIKFPPLGGFVCKSDFLSVNHIQSMVDAICAENALPNLTSLSLNGLFSTHGLSYLTEHLSLPGVLPSLKQLAIEHEFDDYSDSEVEMVADMIEARAKHATSGALEKFDGMWFQGGPTQARIRMLRVLLPSLKELTLLWETEIGTSCFGNDLSAPNLEKVDMYLSADAVGPSAEVWEVLPALKTLFCRELDAYGTPRAVLAETLAETFRRGVGFRDLHKLDFTRLMFKDAGGISLVNALADSDVGRRLTHLTFWKCGLGRETAQALGVAVGDDRFPALTHLDWNSNKLGDNGVMALAVGLQRAPRTRLVDLSLENVGMRDGGIGAIGSLLRGPFCRLKSLAVNENGISDEGLWALAQGVRRAVGNDCGDGGQAGLPALETLKVGGMKTLTESGLAILACAVVEHCQRLQVWHMVPAGDIYSEDYPDAQLVIEGILRAAGCEGKVQVLRIGEDEEEQGWEQAIMGGEEEEEEEDDDYDDDDDDDDEY